MKDLSRYSLSNFKEKKEDGHVFVKGFVCKDDKVIATFEGGGGACISFSYTSDEEKDLFLTAVSDAGISAKHIGLDEMAMDYLVDIHDRFKQFKRSFKKEVCFVKEGAKPSEYSSIPLAVPTDKIIAHVNKNYPNAVILNSLSDLELRSLVLDWSLAA